MQHWDLGPGRILAVCPQSIGCHTATCLQANLQPDPQACCPKVVNSLPDLQASRRRSLQFTSQLCNNQCVMLWLWVCHRDTCRRHIARVCGTGIRRLETPLWCVPKASDVMLRPARRPIGSLIHRHAISFRICDQEVLPGYAALGSGAGMHH